MTVPILPAVDPLAAARVDFQVGSSCKQERFTALRGLPSSASSGLQPRGLRRPRPGSRDARHRRRASRARTLLAPSRAALPLRRPRRTAARQPPPRTSSRSFSTSLPCASSFRTWRSETPHPRTSCTTVSSTKCGSSTCASTSPSLRKVAPRSASSWPTASRWRRTTRSTTATSPTTTV